MRKLVKRNNKKGFTLVEVIVVLVILAILAAILIPSMIGWIDKAEEKTALADARTTVIAAQTIVSENYTTYRNADPAVTALTDDDVTAAEELAAVSSSIESSTLNNGQVTGLEVDTAGGKTVTYSIVDGKSKFEVE